MGVAVVMRRVPIFTGSVWHRERWGAGASAPRGTPIGDAWSRADVEWHASANACLVWRGTCGGNAVSWRPERRHVASGARRVAVWCRGVLTIEGPRGTPAAARGPGRAVRGTQRALRALLDAREISLPRETELRNRRVHLEDETAFLDEPVRYVTPLHDDRVVAAEKVPPRHEKVLARKNKSAVEAKKG